MQSWFLARILTSGIKRYLYYLHFSISSPILPASFDLLSPTKGTVSRSHGFPYEEVQQKVAQTWWWHGKARVAQWWEHSPPTIVARVQIPASTPYVGWVCCWFSPLLREISQMLVFPSPQKPTLANSNSTRWTKNQLVEVLPPCKSLFIIYSLFKWKWVLFSLYKHPTQMMANQCDVIFKIPLLKIRPNWQKVAAYLQAWPMSWTRYY